jgi:hypothetical protein
MLRHPCPSLTQIPPSGTFGVSPAIANAIHDAVGVRLTELPLTAEAVLRAIRKSQRRPLE